MGWLRLSNTDVTSIVTHGTKNGDASTEHLEHVDLDLAKRNDTFKEDVGQIDIGLRRRYPAQPIALSDESLPFLSSDVIRASEHDPIIVWIVIDDIVYDCSRYVQEHPGGSTVIKSFSGQDCSWQFWRFHNQKIMREQGRALRIGRTNGIVNRFRERPRFVGLRRHGGDDDW